MADSNHPRQNLAKMIDLTLLKPTATREEILALCAEAKSLNVCTVCVSPAWIPTAAQSLRGSSVLPITVVGFPLGATTSRQKAEEARTSIEDGAQEIDMVLNIGAMLAGDEATVRGDIRGVVAACGKIPLKVIIETAYLSPEQIYAVSQWCAAEGAAFVKTSTGFAPRGASVDDIKTIRRALHDCGALPKVGIKASGGIRDYPTAIQIIEAGATRIGASASAAIIGGGDCKAGVTSPGY